MWRNLKSFFSVTGREDERIHPYYEAPLSEANTFERGLGLARNFKLLLALSETTSYKLSSLKFSPLPLQEPNLFWNFAEEGVSVFKNLLQILKSQDPDLQDVEELTLDLERMLFAFEVAAKESTRFTLVRRFGTSGNLLMWEGGKGSLGTTSIAYRWDD